MINPWLLTIRPMVLPTEARETLERLRFNKSPETVLDETWKARGESEPAQSKGAWPILQGPQPAARYEANRVQMLRAPYAIKYE